MSVQTLTREEVSQKSIEIFKGCGKQELTAEEVISLINDIRFELGTSDYSVLPERLRIARSLAVDAQMRNVMMYVKVETLLDASK